MSTHNHAEQEAPRRPSMRDAASGIFDRMGRFTADQRAEVFWLMENRWCWDCGEEYEQCGCVSDAPPTRDWPRIGDEPAAIFLVFAAGTATLVGMIALFRWILA